MLRVCDVCGHGVREHDRDAIRRLVLDVGARDGTSGVGYLIDWLGIGADVPDQLAVLDIGCWTGDFLAALPASWTRVGIEPNPRAAATARERGLDVIPTAVEHAEVASSTFDLVTLFDVLEHLSDPLTVLRAASGSLKPGGRLTLLTGNLASLGGRTFGADWYYARYPEHVTFLTPHSARLLLLDAGLEIETLARVAHPHARLRDDVRKVLLPKHADGTRAEVTLRGQLGLNLTTVSRLVRGRDHLLIHARRPK